MRYAGLTRKQNKAQTVRSVQPYWGVSSHAMRVQLMALLRLSG